MNNSEPTLRGPLERIDHGAEVRPRPGKQFVLALGEAAMVNGDFFYLASGADDLPDGLNHDVPYFLLQPLTLDVLEGRGFKGIRHGEAVSLGRYHERERFDYSGFVSRNHAEVMASFDRQSLLISDLQSQGGTYIGELKPRVMRLGPIEEEEPFLIPSGRLVDLAGELPEPAADGASYPSRAHPERNYDAFYTHEERGSFGVFDGVGLSLESAEAAEKAREIVKEELVRHDLTQSPAHAEEIMRHALRAAHDEISALYKGVGATTAAIAQRFSTPEDKDYIAIAHAGDSRVYRYRDGELQVLTLDHGSHGTSRAEREAVQKLLSTAMSLIDIADTSAERSYGERHIITSCLGGPAPLIDTTTADTREGDVFLLTTDGVHDNLTDTELEQLVSYAYGSPTASDTICRYAQKRSRDLHNMRSKPDDMTAIVVVV